MKQKTESYWISTTQGTAYPELKGDKVTVDVAIIGAGITGLTAAVLLKQAGKKVAVLERTRVATGESGHTTAHLTEIVDTRYYRIESRFGREAARLVAGSSRAAIEKIAELSERLEILCDFKRVPAYLYAERLMDVWNANREVHAAQRAGVRAAWTKDVPLHFQTRGALKVDNQARFHPRKYLLGLAAAVHGNGSGVFENTLVLELKEGEPCEVITANGRLRAKKLFVATNSPNSSPFLLQAKVAAYRTYALAARLQSPNPPPGLYWDMKDPYHYIRETDGAWIIGGEDHKTGESRDTDAHFRMLREYTTSQFGPVEFLNHWSGQIMEPADGLPYMGQNPLSEHVYVATGFSGNGMTFGTASGMLVSDMILNKKNAWEPLYRPSRIKPITSSVTLISENKDYPIRMVKDRLEHLASTPASEFGIGEAHVVRWEGEAVAAYRDDTGKVHACSAVCPHMGCHVHFNNAEKSWDCPCHGSRFDVDGKVMNGPAMRNLSPVTAGEKPQKKRKTAA
ncbi:MAG: hypothetical protein A2X94_14300 [Bdellovibrionales bacterium GWB1_55_8]|nr:MAG: hypothetical protein A2X94_14300 [Bdellovibrionales bacterium GWB1_55_8]